MHCSWVGAAPMLQAAHTAGCTASAPPQPHSSTEFSSQVCQAGRHNSNGFMQKNSKTHFQMKEYQSVVIGQTKSGAHQFLVILLKLQCSQPVFQGKLLHTLSFYSESIGSKSYHSCTTLLVMHLGAQLFTCLYAFPVVKVS